MAGRCNRTSGRPRRKGQGKEGRVLWLKARAIRDTREVMGYLSLQLLQGDWLYWFE